VPDFGALSHGQPPGRARGEKRWRFFAEHKLGKVWYELLIESACVVAFAADIVVQVREFVCLFVCLFVLLACLLLVSGASNTLEATSLLPAPAPVPLASDTRHRLTPYSHLRVLLQALGSGVRPTLRYPWTQLFIAFLLFDVVGMLW
jgi:hypothetical protein